MSKVISPKRPRVYMTTAWFLGLMAEVQRTSVTAVAARLGFSRTSISQVCNGCGPYGEGRSSTTNIEIAYRREFEGITCPHTQTTVDVAHCRDVALRNAPSHNPLQMLQWQACQNCSNKPKKEIAP